MCGCKGCGQSNIPTSFPMILISHTSCNLPIQFNHILTLFPSLWLGPNSFSPKDGDSLLLRDVDVKTRNCIVLNPKGSKLKNLLFLEYKTLTSIYSALSHKMGTAAAQWLRCCATNRKVTGSIPAGVEFFTDIKSFRSHYGSGVDSASNRNGYQEHFLGVKAAGA